MKKKRVLAMVLALSLLMGQTVYAQESGPVPEEKLFVEDVSDVEDYSSDKAVSTATITSKESYSDAFEVLELVNEEREKEGLAALTMDRDLLEAAMLRGSELGLYFNHTRPTNMDCFTACDKMYGENIAAGQSSPARVMDSWMNSDGHRGNILDEDYKSIGIGAVTIDGVPYWVQCFGFDAADSVSEASYTDTVVVRDIQFDADFDELDYGILVEKTTLNVGETESVQFYFNNDFTTTNLEPDYLNYQSTDSFVCTVDSGKIEAVGSGSADITVSLLKSPEVAFSNTITVNAHEYGEPEWIWSDDYSSATARFTCTCGENHVETVEAAVTSETIAATCEEAGKTIYTAACEFEGKTYTDTQEVQIDALGHSYTSEFTWTAATDADGNKGYTATADIKCVRDDAEYRDVEAVVVKDEDAGAAAACTEEGKAVFIATATVYDEDNNVIVEINDKKEDVISALGHDYGEPVWDWADDYSGATATITCKRDANHRETADAEVTISSSDATCTEAGITTYTATATLNGKTYTDKKTVTGETLGHEYKAVFTWADATDEEAEVPYTATVKLVCDRCEKEITDVPVTVALNEEKSVAVTCEEDGKNVYTATATHEGKEYTSTKTDTVKAPGHAYGEPTWTWSEGFLTATATFTCANEETHVKVIEAAVTSESSDATCETAGTVIYTATVEMEGKTYTNVKTVEGQVLGHDYGEPEWIWAEDYSSAKAIFSCANCVNQETVDAVITKEIDRDAEKMIYTATVTLDGKEYTDVQEGEGISDADINPFTDVSEDDYYYDAVLWAFNNNITTGYDETHFAPLEDCTRAQVVTFLWRAVGEPEPETAKQPFVDVAEVDYYYKAVLWAYENGITTGKDETHFAPKEKVSREQFVTFLYRQKGEPAYTTENPFVDVEEGTFYYDAILWAYENGITTGTDATHFSPEAICIRGDVVTFLYRAYGEEE